MGYRYTFAEVLRISEDGIRPPSPKRVFIDLFGPNYGEQLWQSAAPTQNEADWAGCVNWSFYELNRHLSTNTYIGSEAYATAIDYQQCEEIMFAKIDVTRFPHLVRWRRHIAYVADRFPTFDLFGKPIPVGSMPVFTGNLELKCLLGEWHAGRKRSFRIGAKDNGRLYVTAKVDDLLWSSELHEAGECWLMGAPGKECISICLHTQDEAVFTTRHGCEHKVKRMPFSLGQYVKVDADEKFVEKAFASLPNIYWTDDRREFLGKLGMVLQVDGTDSTILVGQWLLSGGPDLQRAISCSDSWWLPATVLTAASKEMALTTLEVASCAKNFREGSTAVSLSLPIRLPVVAISGNIVANVVIESMDAQVREIKNDVARQAGISDTITIALFMNGNTTPLADTARWQIYADELSNCQSLMLVLGETEEWRMDPELGTRAVTYDEMRRRLHDKKWSEDKLKDHWDKLEVCEKVDPLGDSEDGLKAQKRIRKELSDIESIPGIDLRIMRDDLSQLEISISGPRSSPYADGTFLLSFRYADYYPFLPPVVRFITRVYHCNVNANTGQISLDILQDQWSPALTLRAIILSIQALMDNPNPYDPIEADIAEVYLQDRQRHDATVQEWVRLFAT